MAGASRDSVRKELARVSLKLLSRTLDASSPWPSSLPTLEQWLRGNWPEEFAAAPVRLLQTRIREVVKSTDQDELVPDTAVTYVRAISLLFEPEASEHLRGMKEGKHYSHALELLVSEAGIYPTKRAVELMSKRIRLRLADALLDSVPTLRALSGLSNTAAADPKGYDDREGLVPIRRDGEPAAQFAYALPDSDSSAEASDFQHQLSVHLAVDLQGTTGRLTCSAAVTSSNFDAWYVDMLAGGADGRLFPGVNIEIGTALEALTFNYHHGAGESWDRSRLRREFETGLLSVYNKRVDVLVREAARIGVQYLHGYYKTLEDFAHLVEAVLNRDWLWSVGAGVHDAEAWIDDGTSMHLRIADEELRTDSGQPIPRRPEYLSDLSLRYLIEMGLPAIISRGLKGGCVHQPERFFDPGNWRIDLS